MSLQNTAKHRYFNCLASVGVLQDNLRLILSTEDMTKIEAGSEKALEAMFTRSKERLIRKFNILRGLHPLHT